MIGHRLMGLSLLDTGEIAGGRAHLDRAIALYDPASIVIWRAFSGQDVGASGLWPGGRWLCYWSATPRTALADGVLGPSRSRRESRAPGDPDLRAEFQRFPACLLWPFRSGKCAHR